MPAPWDRDRESFTEYQDRVYGSFPLTRAPLVGSLDEKLAEEAQWGEDGPDSDPEDEDG